LKIAKIKIEVDGYGLQCGQLNRWPIS